MTENHQDGQETLRSISALPDFAQIFSFLQYFGKLLFLPKATIYELENFFKEGYLMLENPITFTQWRLLNNVCRKEGQSEWQRMAVKFGRRRSVLSQTVPYGELPVKKRLKIFRLSCEEQFDSNARFKLELKKTVPPGAMQDQPLGADRHGTRHWIFRDSAFDFRLFGESEYDEPPPKLETWVELARSVDDLAVYIATLESRWTATTPLSKQDERPPSIDDRNYVDPQSPAVYPATSTSTSSEGSARDVGGGDFQRKDARKSSRKPKPKKSAKTLEKEKEFDGGCLKCHKDVNYKQMLLCDGCDNECHTYCQYPVLWNIPKGRWICPLCKEKTLLEKLRVIHSELSQGRTNRERALERKQRSVARLQKSGLLLKNIIMDDDSGLDSRRSKRSRKEVNYAELNDVYLPPLGPNDYIRSDELGRSSHSAARVRFEDEKEYPRESVHSIYGTRYSKRTRGVSAVGLEEDSEDDDNMECEVTQLPEPRMIYSDSDSDNDEKLSWNEDLESGMGTEDGELEVHDSRPGTQTWVTGTSDPSSSNNSPANSDLSSHRHSDVNTPRCDFSPRAGSVDRTSDPTGSSWVCGDSFLPQRAAENWEAL